MTISQLARKLNCSSLHWYRRDHGSIPVQAWIFLGQRWKWTICPNILATCLNCYDVVEKHEGHMMRELRPTYEVKRLLHMNQSYELIKHVKRNSCLCHFDGHGYLWYDLYHCWLQSWHIPFVTKCDITDTLLPYGVAEVKFQPVQTH